MIICAKDVKFSMHLSHSMDFVQDALSTNLFKLEKTMMTKKKNSKLKKLFLILKK